MSDIIVFTKPGCPYCASATEDLRRKGAAYTEHDVQADSNALRRMLDLNGNRRLVPTIVEDDRVTVGFHGY